MAKVVHGEKFELDEGNDFKHWERYDTVYHKGDNKTDKLSMAVVPEYVSKELQDLDQPLQYNLISCVKSGLKSGRKLSNTDSRWVEKWFEVKCKDISENAEKN